MNIDKLLIEEFENSLNPAYPEKSGVVPHILGYGEISTTFSLASMPDVAFKRMPPFDTPEQISAYQKAVHQYCALLRDECGIQALDMEFFSLVNRNDEHILYVAQPRLPKESIGHNVLKNGATETLQMMINAVMPHLIRLYQFNDKNEQNFSIGLDGQLSNWSFQRLKDKDSAPVYFDITTPLFRVNGIEQLDTDIFLKSCPSFLVWLVKWQFLDDVLDRYHDVRLILIDLVANFYKEGRDDLIDTAVSTINKNFEDADPEVRIAPLERPEIDRYYKNDAFIWALFLFLRRMDRFIKTKLFRQRYNFILPGRIKR